MLCFIFTIFVLDNFLLSAHARHVVRGVAIISKVGGGGMSSVIPVFFS